MEFDKGTCVIRMRVGKLEYENKILTPKTEKGILSVYVSLEGMIIFEWKRSDVTFIETEMILFPGDVICQIIPNRNSAYIKIKETNRAFFFWSQEKNISDFNKGVELMQKVFNGEKVEIYDTTVPKEVQPIYKMDMYGRWTIVDVNLKKILDVKKIENMLKEHPEDIEQLALLCPPGEVENKTGDELIQVIVDNIRSNQFQETLRLIETAIHSGEGDVICKQLGGELHHQGFGGVRLILRDLISKYKL